MPPGQVAAFDLLLPRGATIDRRFGTTVYCTVPLGPEDFANWVRRSSDEADALVGPSGTIFTNVRVKGAPPEHHLRIEISAGAMGQTTAVIDQVPDSAPPQATPTSNEEVMKKAGLTPDGKWLDPKHLE